MIKLIKSQRLFYVVTYVIGFIVFFLSFFRSFIYIFHRFELRGMLILIVVRGSFGEKREKEYPVLLLRGATLAELRHTAYPL